MTPTQKPALLSDRHRRTILWSLLITASAYLLVVFYTGHEKVTQAFTTIGLTGWFFLFTCSLLNYFLRYLRWQYYISHAGWRLPHKTHFLYYLAGFALTTTPGKAGEMLRSVFLARVQIPYTKSIAAFFSERLADLLSVLGLTLFGVATYPAGRPVFYFLLATAAIILLVLHSQRLLDLIRQLIDRFLRGKTRKFAGNLVDIVLHSRRLYRWAPLGWSLLLGLIAWAAEAYAFHLMTGWMGLELAWPVTFFIYAFSMIVGAISFLPGGLGGAELTMVTLLMLNRVAAPEAVALTVLIRVTTLWFAVMLGVAALVRHRHP
jgi:uncharacterized protein (TIRG00374 family)